MAYRCVSCHTGATNSRSRGASRWPGALLAHDEVLRSSIEAHEGWLFKHTGDGVCAAFASPKFAVDAAVAAQRALELPVRIGLATGEAEQLQQQLLGGGAGQGVGGGVG